MPTIGGQHCLEPCDAPCRVKACAPAIQKWMPLASGGHIRLAGKAQLHRPPGDARGERCRSCHPRRIAFLAAKTAAHAPAAHGDTVEITTQHACCNMLHLGRVLGGGSDGDIAILARYGNRDLAFQIEMLLPARAKFA